MSDDDTLASALLREYGIRVTPHMREYIRQRIGQGASAPLFAGAIPVIGADARTGVPLRITVDPLRLDARSDKQT